MKKIMIFLLTFTVLLVGCDMEIPTETVTPSTSETVEPTAASSTTSVEMPQLEDLDYSNMDFFEDGFEVVEYKSLSDGDTATFVVGGLPLSTRFLAIDTPETNSPTTGVQPWAYAAKEYTKEKLSNAKEIILEKDDESDIFDDYDRLLAWVWVDGELLNFKLVEEGLATVRYLYGDYKYNSEMMQIESVIQKQRIKVWGEDDPDYNYTDEITECTIDEAKNLENGASVTVSGIITNMIGTNAFIQDDTGAIYVYANKVNYKDLVVGNEIQINGLIVEYNDLMEISSIENISAVSTNNVIEPKEISLSEIGEELESQYISVKNVEIINVNYTEGEKGYTIYIKQNNVEGQIRIDKYLKSYPDPASLKDGSKISVVGNIGQYLENYQIMISDETAITYE